MKILSNYIMNEVALFNRGIEPCKDINKGFVFPIDYSPEDLDNIEMLATPNNKYDLLINNTYYLWCTETEHFLLIDKLSLFETIEYAVEIVERKMTEDDILNYTEPTKISIPKSTLDFNLDDFYKWHSGYLRLTILDYTNGLMSKYHFNREIIIADIIKNSIISEGVKNE